MSQFMVYRLPGGQLVLDLQTNLMDTAARVVAPLAPTAQIPALGRLHPVFDIGEVPHTLVTTEMVGLPKSVLGPSVADFRADEERIRRAIDMVFSGF